MRVERDNFLKYTKVNFILIILFGFSVSLFGQRFELKEKIKQKGDVIEIYHVLRKHKRIRHGLYLKYLRERIIINGYYDNNEKIGIWKYYDGLKRVQLEYDFDKKKVIEFNSFQDTTTFSQPPLLLGSTIELKYKINKLIRYPREAWINGFSGEIIVGVSIDTTGTITGYSIEKGCEENLNEEALRVVKIVAEEYQWLPAIMEDHYTNSKYLIPIRFEMQGHYRRRN